MNEVKVSLRMSIGGQSRCQPFHSLKVVAIVKFVVGFLPMTLLSIFSKDCICFFIFFERYSRALFLGEIRVFQACACGDDTSME